MPTLYMYKFQKTCMAVQTWKLINTVQWNLYHQAIADHAAPREVGHNIIIIIERGASNIDGSFHCRYRQNVCHGFRQCMTSLHAESLMI